jgi:hypothetical protein
MRRLQWTILSFVVLVCGCGKNPGVSSKNFPSLPDVVQREVNSCVENTVRSAFEDGRGSESKVAISIEEISAACSELGFDPEDANVKFGVLRELLPDVLETLVPSSKTEYGAWDRILMANAVRVLNSGGKIRELLDPRSRSAVVGFVAEALTLVDSEFRLHPSLAYERDAILQMGAGWGLRGFALSDVEARRVLNALSNSIDPFLVSTRELISALSLDPVSNLATVEFADSLDLDYKAKARLAKQLADTLKQDDWLAQVFDKVLQKKVSTAELDSAIDRLSKCQADPTLCRL